MTSLSDKDRGVVAPVELQVGRQVENLFFVHGAPDEADEEDLHPAALQQVDAVDQLQLRVACHTHTQLLSDNAVPQQATHVTRLDLEHVMTSCSDTHLGWTWPT